LVHAALCLDPEGDREVLRCALDLSAPTLATALEQLMRCGLLEGGGLLRGHEAARRALAAQPDLEAFTALSLARQRSGPQAFPLYRLGRGLWTPEDEPRVRRAFVDWAKELLRRGFPDQALTVLQDAPNHPTVRVLGVRALERAGQYREALVQVEDCPGAEARALEAKLRWRLGQPEEAQRVAQTALDGPMEARAEALNTLGKLHYAAGEHALALRCHQRAATLWHGLGEQLLWAQALNNVGVTLIALGQDPVSVLQQSVAAAHGDVSFRVHFLINLGKHTLDAGQPQRSEPYFLEAGELAESLHLPGPASVALGNLGVALHIQNHREEAERTYLRSLELARQSGDRMQIGSTLANLAELRGDLEAWEDAAAFLEQAGWLHLAQGHRQNRAAFQARSEPQWQAQGA